MSMIKVAIITRTRNRPVFLKRALQSVGRQTYGNYVHVIVNDGGEKEEIADLVRNLPEPQQGKTKVFHRDTASGAPDTIFNESIDRVDSKYFAIHDDDDTWHPDFLKETVGYLEGHDEIGAVVTRTDKVIEMLHDTKIIEKKRSQWMSDVLVVNLYRQCIDNQMTPISTLYRREAYETVGKFDSTLPVVGDWEFGVRLLQKYDVDFIDTGYALAEYHHREGGDNSFAAHNHRYYTNKVMNAYLRDELMNGKLGVGYIMSKLKYDQNNLSTLVRRITPSFIGRYVRRKVRN